jgi:large subunit ribosomal protein L21
MFAVLKTGGKQYKVKAGDMLRVEKVSAHAGETIQFNEILMLGGDTTVLGTPMIAGAAVQAEVVDQIKSDKTINFVKRRRKHGSQRTKGHRQKLTLLRVTDILSKGGDKSGVKSALGGSVAEVTFNKAAPAVKVSPAKKLAGAKVVPADMTSSATAPEKLKTRKGGDDLTKLSGVGPALLKKLNAADIVTFQQIAAWTSDDVVSIDEKLSLKGRIGREGWIEQAKELANKV